jgi:hypothetical protein
MASGIFSCIALSVSNGRGALPMAQMVRLDRSASANRGWSLISLAMAGTMNVADGRRCSTWSIHTPASKRARYRPAMPSFIGLKMKPMPAKVNSGEPWSQPSPLKLGSDGATSERLSWRTATPLGRPVVPLVYMMSARSDPSTGTWYSLSSLASSASNGCPAAAVGVHDGAQLGEPVRDGLDGRPQRGGGQDHRRAGVAEDGGDLVGAQPGVGGHRHRAGLVDRRVRGDPGDQLGVGQEDADPVAGRHAVGHQTPGQAVRRRLPRREGDRLAGVEQRVADLVGERAGHRSQLVHQQVRHRSPSIRSSAPRPGRARTLAAHDRI